MIRLVAAAGAALLYLTAAAEAQAEPTDPAAALVRIVVTAQRWDYARPWQRRQPELRRGLGVVLAGRRVLTAAGLVEDAVQIFVLRPYGTDRYEAEVTAADYGSDLALLTVADEELFEKTAPITVADEIAGDAPLEIMQIEENGDVRRSSARLIAMETWRNAWGPVLNYRFAGALRFRRQDLTLPVVHQDRLVGMLNWYRVEDGEGGCSSVPFLRNFLERVDAGLAAYPPKLGISVAHGESAELRRYRGVPGELDGVFVEDVQAGRPAAAAGIQTGDLILAINGHAIDREGQLRHPRYGRIYWALIVTTEGRAGAVMPVAIWRDGQRRELAVKLAAYDPCDDVSPLLCPGREPRFLMEGGFVFSELSEPYLREWGKDWELKAPTRLVTFNAFQFDLFNDGPRRIVILTQVLPSKQTMGLSPKLMDASVVEANGRPVRSLEDLAEAFKSPQAGFQQLKLDGQPYRLIFDAEEARALSARMREEYGIPADFRG